MTHDCKVLQASAHPAMTAAALGYTQRVLFQPRVPQGINGQYVTPATHDWRICFRPGSTQPAIPPPEAPKPR
jgi:hypothetical protein